MGRCISHYFLFQHVISGPMSLTSNTMAFTVGRLLYTCMTEISENALLNHSQHDVCHERCLSRTVSVTDVSVTDGLVYQLYL